MNWQDKAIAATRGTQLGAAIQCALGRGRAKLPRFEGKAIVTSDGYLQCDFVDNRGEGHHSAFIGHVSELSNNVEGLAKHLKLNPADHNDLTAVISAWIGTDYRV
jgi:hypothetical protein